MTEPQAFNPSQPFTVFDPSKPFTPVQDVPVDARGVPLSAPRDARGQIITSSEEQPPSALMQMLGPLAHPQTLTDFARLLTLPVDSVKKALAGALATAAARPVAGAAISATGRGMENAGTTAATDARNLGALDLLTNHGVKRAAAIAAAPPVLRVVGRGLQRVGSAVTGSPVVAEAAPVVSDAAPVADAATIRPTGSGASLPDQRALNEAALAARRAAYQASQNASPAAAEPIVAASGKMQLTAPEMREFQRLIQRGVALPDALKQVRDARELAASLGVEPPPVSATKFPKGMRGKSPGGD